MSFGQFTLVERFQSLNHMGMLETAAFRGWNAKDAIEWFHGSGRLVEAAAISKVDPHPEYAGQWSVPQQESKTPQVPPALLEIKINGVFNEIDKQLLILSHAAAASIDTQAYPGVKIADAAPSLSVHEIAVPSQSGRWLSHEPQSGQGLQLFIVTSALLMALGLGWFGGPSLCRYFDKRDELTGRAAVNA